MTTSFACDNITAVTRKTCDGEGGNMRTNKCKELRGNRTQADIARFLGITQQQYSNIENSKNPPKIETCIKLSKIFDKPIDYIFPNIFLSNNTSTTCEIK